jgi:hypothetical protein
MPRVRILLVVLSVFTLLVTVGGRAESGGAVTGMSSDQAVELAKKTGRPILAVAGTET